MRLINIVILKIDGNRVLFKTTNLLNEKLISVNKYYDDNYTVIVLHCVESNE